MEAKLRVLGPEPILGTSNRELLVGEAIAENAIGPFSRGFGTVDQRYGPTSSVGPVSVESDRSPITHYPDGRPPNTGSTFVGDAGTDGTVLKMAYQSPGR